MERIYQAIDNYYETRSKLLNLTKILEQYFSDNTPLIKEKETVAFLGQELSNLKTNYQTLQNLAKALPECDNSTENQPFDYYQHIVMTSHYYKNVEKRTKYLKLIQLFLKIRSEKQIYQEAINPLQLQCKPWQKHLESKEELADELDSFVPALEEFLKAVIWEDFDSKDGFTLLDNIERYFPKTISRGLAGKNYNHPKEKELEESLTLLSQSSFLDIPNDTIKQIAIPNPPQITETPTQKPKKTLNKQKSKPNSEETGESSTELLAELTSALPLSQEEVKTISQTPIQEKSAHLPILNPDSQTSPVQNFTSLTADKTNKEVISLFAKLGLMSHDHMVSLSLLFVYQQLNKNKGKDILKTSNKNKYLEKALKTLTKEHVLLSYDRVETLPKLFTLSPSSIHAIQQEENNAIQWKPSIEKDKLKPISEEITIEQGGKKHKHNQILIDFLQILAQDQAQTVITYSWHHLSLEDEGYCLSLQLHEGESEETTSFLLTSEIITSSNPLLYFSLGVVEQLKVAVESPPNQSILRYQNKTLFRLENKAWYPISHPLLPLSEVSSKILEELKAMEEKFQATHPEENFQATSPQDECLEKSPQDEFLETGLKDECLEKNPEELQTTRPEEEIMTKNNFSLNLSETDKILQQIPQKISIDTPAPPTERDPEKKNNNTTPLKLKSQKTNPTKGQNAPLSEQSFRLLALLSKVGMLTRAQLHSFITLLESQQKQQKEAPFLPPPFLTLQNQESHHPENTQWKERLDQTIDKLLETNLLILTEKNFALPELYHLSPQGLTALQTTSLKKERCPQHPSVYTFSDRCYKENLTIEDGKTIRSQNLILLQILNNCVEKHNTSRINFMYKLWNLLQWETDYYSTTAFKNREAKPFRLATDLIAHPQPTLYFNNKPDDYPEFQGITGDTLLITKSIFLLWQKQEWYYCGVLHPSDDDLNFIHQSRIIIPEAMRDDELKEHHSTLLQIPIDDLPPFLTLRYKSDDEEIEQTEESDETENSNETEKSEETQQSKDSDETQQTEEPLQSPLVFTHSLEELLGTSTLPPPDPEETDDILSEIIEDIPNKLQEEQDFFLNFLTKDPFPPYYPHSTPTLSKEEYENLLKDKKLSTPQALARQYFLSSSKPTDQQSMALILALAQNQSLVPWKPNKTHYYHHLMNSFLLARLLADEETHPKTKAYLQTLSLLDHFTFQTGNQTPVYFHALNAHLDEPLPELEKEQQGNILATLIYQLLFPFQAHDHINQQQSQTALTNFDILFPNYKKIKPLFNILCQVYQQKDLSPQGFTPALLDLIQHGNTKNNPEFSQVNQKSLQNLRDRLLDMLNHSKKSLEKLPSSVNPALLFWTLELSQQKLQGKDQPKNLLSNLLQTGLFIQNQEFIPFFSPNHDRLSGYQNWKRLLQHIASQNTSLEEAKNNTYSPQSHCLENLYQEKFISYYQTGEILDNSYRLPQATQRAHTQSQNLSNQIKLNMTLEHLTEQEGTQLLNLLQEEQQFFFTNEAFGCFQQFCTALHGQIHFLTEEKVSKLKAISQSLQEEFDLNPIQEVLENHFEEGNILLAQSLLNDRILNKPTSIEYPIEQDYFQQFQELTAFFQQLTKKYPSIPLFLEEIANELHRKLGQNSTQSDILSTETLLAQWLTNLGNTSQDRERQKNTLTKLLSLLGFQNPKLYQEETHNEEYSYKLQLSVNPEPVHTIPSFGSNPPQNIQLTVLSLDQLTDIISLSEEILSSTKQDTNLILLPEQTLTLNDRRQLTELLHKKQAKETILVLDRAVFLFVASLQEQSRLKAFLSLTLPFTSYNPYLSTPFSTELFFGREQELKQLLQPQSTSFLFGSEKIGKTSLLQQAETLSHSPEENKYAYLCDLISSNTEEKALTTISNTLKKKNAPIHQLTSFPDLCNKIEKLLKSGPCKSFYLFLDHSDSLCPILEPIISSLLTLQDSCEGKFKLILSGRQKVKELAFTIEGRNKTLEKSTALIGLSSEASLQLLTKPLKTLGFQLPDTKSQHCLQGILSKCQNHPYLIQSLGKALVQSISKSYEKGEFQASNANPQFPLTEQHLTQVVLDTNLNTMAKELFFQSFSEDAHLIIAQSLALCYFLENTSPLNTSYTPDKIMTMTEHSEFNPILQTNLHKILQDLTKSKILHQKEDGSYTFYQANDLYFLTLSLTEEQSDEKSDEKINPSRKEKTA